MRRIICVGNRYVAGDDLGPLVYDYLRCQSLPAQVEVIDGGLAGLNLLSFVEGASHLIFVDALTGEGPSGQAIVLSGLTAFNESPLHYNHATGLAYLLGVLPHLYPDELPEIIVVGAVGQVDPQTIAQVADCCLNIINQLTTGG